MSVCFTSFLPLRGDEERKEHFNNLQQLRLTLELGQSLVKVTSELWTDELRYLKPGEWACVCMALATFPVLNLICFPEYKTRF